MFIALGSAILCSQVAMNVCLQFSLVVQWGAHLQWKECFAAIAPSDNLQSHFPAI